MPSLPPSQSPSWLSRDRADPSPSLDIHQLHTSQVSLSPTFTSPRAAPKAPSFKTPTFKGFQSVFHRKHPHSPSQVSLHASDSPGNILDNHNHHHYAAMPPPPVSVVSNHDTLDDEQECPVCLEPLSFSFRLPGEKPHVVPECGHSLHEVSAQIHSIFHFTYSTSPRRVSLLFMDLSLPSQGLPSLASRIWACAVSAAVP